MVFIAKRGTSDGKHRLGNFSVVENLFCLLDLLFETEISSLQVLDELMLGLHHERLLVDLLLELDVDLPVEVCVLNVFGLRSSVLRDSRLDLFCGG